MSTSNESIGETASEAQSQEPKASKLAEYSAVFTVLVIVVAFATAPSLVCLPFAIIGLSFGIIALWQISRSGGRLTGLASAIFAIVINSALPFVILHLEYVRKTNFGLAQRIVCATNLSGLSKAIKNYSADNYGVYPSVDKWCDLLMKSEHTTRRNFVCKSALSEGDEDRCHYAMNPNCKPNSPAHMVFLFESKGDWNQFGGPELLAPENHNGKGCNILFNDGRVEFVPTQRLSELKWKVDPEGTRK